MPNDLSHKITHSSNIICCSNSLGSQAWTIVEVWFYYFRTGYYFSIFSSALKVCSSAAIEKIFDSKQFFVEFLQWLGASMALGGIDVSGKDAIVFSQFIFQLSDRMVGLHVI